MDFCLLKACIIGFGNLCLQKPEKENYFQKWQKKIAAPQTLKTRQLSLSTRDYTYCHDVPSECAFFANQVQGWCGCKKKFTSLGFFAAESI